MDETNRRLDEMQERIVALEERVAHLSAPPAPTCDRGARPLVDKQTLERHRFLEYPPLTIAILVLAVIAANWLWTVLGL